jgi:hypothetical protein
MKIILRIVKILFFLPCCWIDGIILFLIGMPIWVLTGKSIMDIHPPLLQTLFELE